MDITLNDDMVWYYYDRADQLIETKQDGVSVNYTYDKAGNLLTDGRNTYTYNLQNQLTRQTGADGTVNYTYDAAGNLSSDGETTYTYNAENRLILGEKASGESSSYTYNALGVRIGNEQIRENENAGHQNRPLIAGSQWLERYHDVLLDGRFDWQRVFETEVGTTVQNNFETVTKHYVVDYLSVANRDILVTEDGSYTQTYVYDENSARISAEYNYAPGTARGEGGENLASDFADGVIEKIWYRRSLLDSSLFAVDAGGEVIAHMTYDAWGRPEKETYFGVNYAGIDNFNNYTGYTYDEVLELYFAQARFYDPQTKGFTQEDPIKDGLNWYSYVSNNPLVNVDPWGLYYIYQRNDGRYEIVTKKEGWVFIDAGINVFVPFVGGTASGLADSLVFHKNAVGGNSYAEVNSGTIQDNVAKDLAGKFVEDQVERLFIEAAKEAGKTTAGIFINGFSLVSELRTGMLISGADAIVFDYMERANHSNEFDTIEQANEYMYQAYVFIASYAILFDSASKVINPSDHASGRSVDSIIKALYKMEQAGESYQAIEEKKREYFKEFYCSCMLRSSIMMTEIDGRNLFEHYVNGYSLLYPELTIRYDNHMRANATVKTRNKMQYGGR